MLTLTRFVTCSHGGLGEDCAASSLFPAHQNDEPYHHRDGHHEYAHSKPLRNLCEVHAAHGRSLVERRQPHQAWERPLGGAAAPESDSSPTSSPRLVLAVVPVSVTHPRSMPTTAFTMKQYVQTDLEAGR